MRSVLPTRSAIAGAALLVANAGFVRAQSLPEGRRLATDSIVERLRSGAPAERELGATQAVAMLQTPEALEVDPDTTVELLNELLEVLVGGRPPAWLGAPESDETASWSRLGPIGAPDTLFLVTDSLPPAIVEAWRGRVRMITTDDMVARRPAGTFLEIRAIRMIEGLASLSWRQTTQPGGPPVSMPGAGAWASGVQLLLYRTDEGWAWRVLGAWIT